MIETKENKFYEYKIRLKNRIFCYYYEIGFLWFRIFGYGFKIKDINKNPLLFSEKYGYVKGIQIGKWRIGFLNGFKNN